MDRKMVAKELLKMAKDLLAIKFDNKTQMEKYKEDHEVRPGTKLEVKKEEKKELSGPARHQHLLNTHREKEIRRVLKKKPDEKITDEEVRKFNESGGPDRKDVDWFGLGKGKTP